MTHLLIGGVDVVVGGTSWFGKGSHDVSAVSNTAILA
jgi:hypothetical protein